MNCYLFTFLSILSLVSCNSVNIHQHTQSINKSHTAELGVVVIESHKKSFTPKITITGKPAYEISVPLLIQQISPSDGSYKKLKILSGEFKKKDTINTTFKKLGYTAVSIQIKDKIKILENLNTPKSKNTLEYLKNKPSAKLISSVSGILPINIYEKLVKAEAVFLKSAPQNVYEILIYSKDQEKESINIGNTIKVLTYKSEYFCWGIGKKRKVALKDMVYKKCSCEKGNSNKASKIKKDLEYVKF